MVSEELRGKEATRLRILSAATEVFAEKGYHGASVDDIVRGSGTSKGAFYFHFPSKQDIFFALVGKLAGSVADSVEQAIGQRRGAAAKVEAALSRVLEFFSGHRKLAKIVLVGGVGLGGAFDQRLLSLHDQFAALIRRHLEQALQDGDIPSLDPEVTAYAWLGAVNEVVVRWLYTGQPDPLERAIPPLKSILLRSIGVEPVETILARGGGSEHGGTPAR